RVDFTKRRKNVSCDPLQSRSIPDIDYSHRVRVRNAEEARLLIVSESEQGCSGEQPTIRTQSEVCITGKRQNLFSSGSVQKRYGSVRQVVCHRPLVIIVLDDIPTTG